MISQKYDRLFRTLDSLCESETDPIAVMATIACELYHSFDRFNWVGFYRNTGNRVLKIGPYQGSHGCLTIPFEKGVCGKCAREKTLQNVSDITRIPHHIACSESTRSELVVPIMNANDELIAVLDIDSDRTSAFDEIDEENLKRLNKYFQGDSR